MVRRCSIKGCYSPTEQENIRIIHLFPKDEIFRQMWLKAIGSRLKNEGNLNLENSGVCSDHFTESDYLHLESSDMSVSTKRKKLRPFAVPSFQMSRHNTGVPDESYARVRQLGPNNSENRSDVASVHTLTTIEYVKKLELELKETKQALKIKNTTIWKKDSMISDLKEEVRKLKAQLEHFTSRPEDPTQINQRLREMFSPNQIQKIFVPESQVRWSEEDISKAVALNSVSSKCYNYLRDNLSYPLPSQRTLGRWLSKIDIKPGILKPVMQLLQAQFQDCTLLERTSMLAFDDMDIDPKYCYDEKDDKIYGGCSKLGATFIRGLFGNWKQIVHYGFDDRMDKPKLFEIITQLHQVGIDVVGIVCDLGTKNQGLWRDLNICRVKNGIVDVTSFRNPVTGENVWVFPDFPHILKLLRNHLLDDGLILPDGTKIDKSLFEDLLSMQKTELKLTFDVTHRHIYVRGKQRQKVRPAFQLFSTKVAKAIEVAFPARKSEAEFIQLVNDFSDLMNTRHVVPESCNNIHKSNFGSHHQKQCEFLGKTYKYFSELRVGNRKTGAYLPFQKGILTAIRSLIGLYEDVFRRTKCKYIMTSHLNQDHVENAFAIVRGLGGYNINPTSSNIFEI